MLKLKNFGKRLTNFIVSIPKKDFSILLPGLYIIILLFGFILTGIFYIFPVLVTCSDILGREFCTPIGFFISFMASIPGYLLVGNLGSFIEKIPIAISYLLVVGVNILIYFFMGTFIQRLKKGKLLGKNKTVNIILASFIVLLILLILLAR